MFVIDMHQIMLISLFRPHLTTFTFMGFWSPNKWIYWKGVLTQCLRRGNGSLGWLPRTQLPPCHRTEKVHLRWILSTLKAQITQNMILKKPSLYFLMPHHHVHQLRRHLLYPSLSHRGTVMRMLDKGLARFDHPCSIEGHVLGRFKIFSYLFYALNNIPSYLNDTTHWNYHDSQFHIRKGSTC